MSDIEDIYSGLRVAHEANEALSTWTRGPDAWDRYQARKVVIANANAAFERVRDRLRNPERVYVDRAFEKPTACYCAVTNPPCSWCTDPANDPDAVAEKSS